MFQCCSSRDTDERALGQKQRIRKFRQSISLLQEPIVTSQPGASRDPRENLPCVALRWFPLAVMLRYLASQRYPVLPLGNSSGQQDHRLIDVLSSLVAQKQPLGAEQSQQSRLCWKCNLCVQWFPGSWIKSCWIVQVEQSWSDLMVYQETGTSQTLQKFSLRFKGCKSQGICSWCLFCWIIILMATTSVQICP